MRKCLLVITLLLAGAGYFFLGNSESVQQKMDWLSSIKTAFLELDLASAVNNIREREPKQEPDKEIIVYKWQDENGGWHFDDSPPENAVSEPVIVKQIETMDTSDPGNILNQLENADLGAREHSFNPQDSDGPAELIEQAKEVQNVLNDRATQQEIMVDNAN